MNKYRAVGFDHTGVIVGMSASKFHQKVSELLQISIEDLKKIYLKYNSDFNKGRTTKEEFWKSVLQDLNKGSFYDEVMEIVEKPKEIHEEVVEVIKDLRNKGYKLGILSNDTIEGGRLIKGDEGMDKLFDLILISAETGFAKPNKETFTDFMNKLGVSPAELIYIDDAKQNITTAEELGITAILCTDPSNVRKQFEEKGIL